MEPIQRLKLAPERRLIMTFALRQALEVLQMPQLELAAWLQNEIERNPLLEWTASSSSLKASLPDIASPTTLHEHLMQQIRESFFLEEERRIAENLLGHLDERGFLSDPLESIATTLGKPLASVAKVLSILQTFDPPGICARNLQESLFLQLKALGKERSEAGELVRHSFADLLQSRFALIKKRLKTLDLSEPLQILARLSFRPAEHYRQESVSLALPDLHLTKTEGKWKVELDESELPQFRIQSDYLSLKPESSEEQESLRLFKASAKWLIRSLNRRRKLLQDIGRLLIRKQHLYLDQKGPLAPLTAKELSEELQIHESTLSRALAGKYAATPRGLIPLRSLISSSPETHSAQRLLETLIQNEDSQTPLTDDQLAQALRSNGFAIARRTVAKYRKQLNIGSAAQRKHSRKN